MSTAQPDLLPPPRPVTIIRAAGSEFSVDWAALWQFRELLQFLVWRDLKVRYKQTMLGASWAVLQPLATIALFSVVFGHFAKLPSDGLPYPVYSYCALLPWLLFAGVVNRSGTSLVSSANLISKVYFPRLLVPVSAAVASLVDFVISFGVLLVMMLFYRVTPSIAILTVPIWAVLVLLLGLGVGLGLSALNVRYRDVSYLLAFLLQLWMYASPVAYSPSMVPEKWRWLYEFNPMVGYIQGFRWAVLGTTGSMGVPWLPALGFTILLLVAATAYFNRVERSFADVI